MLVDRWYGRVLRKLEDVLNVARELVDGALAKVSCVLLAVGKTLGKAQS